MRPSSLGGGRILRRTLSVRLSVCLSVRPSRYCFCLLYSRTVLRANIQNRKTSVFAYGPASCMYFSARTEGRISYGHLGRTNLFLVNIYVVTTVNRRAVGSRGVTCGLLRPRQIRAATCYYACRFRDDVDLQSHFDRLSFTVLSAMLYPPIKSPQPSVV